MSKIYFQKRRFISLFLIICFSILILLSLSNVWAQNNQDSESASIKRGEYISITADCTSCHTSREEGAQKFAGGFIFSLPMGIIVSSNITPSITQGIGNYSLEEFKKAVQNGIARTGRHLYPAMPYTEYYKISNTDMTDLYNYFQKGVLPIDAEPKEITALQFPFNFPGIMPVWNLLFFDKSALEITSEAEEINRGKYLVESLAHCTTCHTPRNSLMGYQNDKYLGGAFNGGWYAPNITTGSAFIKSLSDSEIAELLREGVIEGKTQVAGPMADAIDYSFRHMTKEDLLAIAGYIKVLPAVPMNLVEPPSHVIVNESIDLDQLEPIQNDIKTTSGVDIYQGACSTCHGIQGEGSLDQSTPALRGNQTLNAIYPNNIIMAIVDGVDRKGATKQAFMPAFGVMNGSISSNLSNKEIAQVSNYILQTFAGRESELTTDDVSSIRSGGKVPFLIKSASTIAITLPLIVIVLVWFGFRSITHRKLKNGKVKGNN